MEVTVQSLSGEAMQVPAEPSWTCGQLRHAVEVALDGTGVVSALLLESQLLADEQRLHELDLDGKVVTVVVAGSTSFLEGTADPSILIEEEGRSLRLQRPETGAKPFYPAVRTKFPLKKGDVHWSSPARVERNPGRRSWN
ncbi:unnamed protein product [Effrenium voratum]|nr:unnamed protein product [Effrenium voratum]